MKELLVVGIGGFIGSVARYKIGGLVLHHTSSWRFPLSTFLINVSGCFVIGALAALAVKSDFFSSDARLFLFTGLLGGYTTFSAFGLEAFFLLRRGEAFIAVAYALLSIVCCLLAVWAAFKFFGGGSHEV